MTALVQFELIAGLSAVLVVCAIAFGILQRKASARNVVARREHLKHRARSL